MSGVNTHLPEKSVKMTSLDTTRFDPVLKLKYNEIQKEFFGNASQLILNTFVQFATKALFYFNF